MDKIVSHKDLIVWQKAITLACKVYAATINLPRDERFGLQAQMRRAAVSIASNIAEGSARRSRMEFIQFLHIARASLAEVETQFLIAVQQRLLTDSDATLEQISEVGRLLNGLIRSLGSANRKAHARACAPLTANRQPLTVDRPPHPPRTHT
jgi:four helix bundle protein